MLGQWARNGTVDFKKTNFSNAFKNGAAFNPVLMVSEEESTLTDSDSKEEPTLKDPKEESTLKDLEFKGHD